MRFGIYPGGYSAAPGQAGPDDDPAAIAGALDELQGESTLLVRGYRVFADPDAPTPSRPASPTDLAQYAAPRRPLDLVVQFHSVSGDVAGFADFVRALVREHADRLASVQVGEEATVTDDPVLDGFYPGVRDALVAGVRAAAEEVARLGLTASVGVNCTPLFGAAAGFLDELVELGGPAFRDAVGHVGLDFFPDVFSPLVAELGPAVRGVLGHHRALLDAAGLGGAELWVTENGWPTGPERSEARQADVLEQVLDAVAESEATTYELSSLRDADSDGPHLLDRFGLTDDGYRPKPAFEVFRAAVSRG